MPEVYHFNTHNVKTKEVNSKVLKIWPRAEDENLRCDILDLIYSPFTVIEGNNLEPVAASGWFIPSLLTDNKIAIDGIEYTSISADSLELGFVNSINSIESCPVTARMEDVSTDRDEIEEYAGLRVFLTAKELGEEGNEITLSCVAAPNPNDDSYRSGETLADGKDTRTIVEVMPGTVYLPSNTIANIPKKENLIVNSDEVDYIVLTLKRNSDGVISYKYSVAKESLEDNYRIIEPIEEIEDTSNES